MARRKVRLADNIARIVEIDDAATVGATLAANLKDTDGKTITTPASMKTWLGIKDPVAAAAPTIRAATPASHQSCPWRRHRRIRTMFCAVRSSISKE